MTAATQLRERAVQIAEELLWPAAAQVDGAEQVPAAHLDALAAAGLYGLAGPDAPADPDLAGFVLETFAGACLATAFVWMQHHGAVRAAASGSDALRNRWLVPLCRGEVRAGVGFAGLRPGRDRMRVRRVDGGWLLDGEIPWVTGWDQIDLVYLGACDEQDVIHRFFVDAVASPSLVAQVQRLTSVQASRTATLSFREHFVGDDRLVDAQPLAEWTAAEASGSAMNGFLAVGVAARCARLLREFGAPAGSADALDAEVTRARARLQAAAGGGEPVPQVRAAVSALASRAAARLTVQVGSRAALAGNPADRLTREAAFLLVFGSRPAIKNALVEALDRAGAEPASC